MAAGRGVDRISGLPDHLLHSILLRLPSGADAVRTSILSRRWRHAWAHVPALSFRAGDQARGASILDGLTASTLSSPPTPPRSSNSIVRDRFKSERGHVARMAPWLRFASRRLAGELSLRFSSPWTRKHVPWPPSEIEVPLPACEHATAIDVHQV